VILVKRALEQSEPGPWWRPTWPTLPLRSAWFKCGKGGHLGTLTDHTIHPDGRVEPSVQCPSCGWHEDSVQLEGWAEAQ
jgi:hypothetical protein